MNNSYITLTEKEIDRVKASIEMKLASKQFKYSTLTVLQKDGKLLMKFTGVSHPYFKNPVITTYESYVHFTGLFTRVYIRLRFNYNGRKSPVLGLTLTNFIITLS